MLDNELVCTCSTQARPLGFLQFLVGRVARPLLQRVLATYAIGNWKKPIKIQQGDDTAVPILSGTVQYLVSILVHQDGKHGNDIRLSSRVLGLSQSLDCQQTTLSILVLSSYLDFVHNTISLSQQKPDCA